MPGRLCVFSGLFFQELRMQLDELLVVPLRI